MITNYVDLEDLVMQWILSTPVADMVVKSDRIQIYLGMPSGSPLPCIVFSRVGGAPSSTSETSEDTGRISFAVWGANRVQAKQISLALVNACDALNLAGRYESESGYLELGNILNWMWNPDDKVARYTIDVNFTSLGKSI